MADRLIQADEVSKHTTKSDCWVVLYGNVYNVTTFLDQHPGGSNVILHLSGQDATTDYDPIHPPGLLEETLRPIGKYVPDTTPTFTPPVTIPESEQSKYVAMSDLLNLNEIEAFATQKLSRKAWAYFYSAGDDLYTKTHNNTIYKSILLRPRIFVDVASSSTTTTLLGHPLQTPLYVSPAAMARLADPEGERGIARGIARFGALQVISNYASQTPEQIVEGSREGQMFGWQLYVDRDLGKSERDIAKVNALSDKIKFIALTLDSPVMGKREDDERVGSTLRTRDASHVPLSAEERRKLPLVGPTTKLTWKKTLKWLESKTDLPIVLKGIQTYEDAYLASKCGGQVKAIILSNHGGRSLDTANTAVHTLLEIRKYCPEVFERVEVWVDGGIKRGTDVVKALCLGAKAVGVGRAALFGLGAGGVEGVERTFEILQAEIQTCMRLLGVARIEDLGPQYINSRAVERDVFDGESAVGQLDSWIKSNL